MGLNSAEGSFLYGFPYDQVFEEAQNALLECKFKIEGRDKASGLIKASASSTLWTWGHNFEIMISEIEGGTRVDVYGKVKTAKVDWGKTRKKIDEFFTTLNERLQGTS